MPLTDVLYIYICRLITVWSMICYFYDLDFLRSRDVQLFQEFSMDGQFWPCRPIYLARLFRYRATDILDYIWALLLLLLLCKPSSSQFCQNLTNFVAMATGIGRGRLW